MTEDKLQETSASVGDFLSAVKPAAKQQDARILLKLFERVTAEKPRMWGGSIIGFGEYHTTYESGRSVNWMRTGFSPQKAKHSLYLTVGYCDEAAAGEREEMLSQLGKYKAGKSCIYINTLADIELEVLEELVAKDWAAMQRIYPE
jgi:hypothetical protein